MVDDLMGGVEILEKLLGFRFRQDDLLKVCGLERKLWIECKNGRALLGFGRCGYLRCAILEQFRVLTVLMRIALTQLADNEILAHGLIMMK